MKIKKMNTLVVLATNTRHVGQLNFFNSGKAGLNTGIANNTKPITPTPIIIQANNVGNPPMIGVSASIVNTSEKINNPNAIATIL